jgi:hypothetical protein
VVALIVPETDVVSPEKEVVMVMKEDEARVELVDMDGKARAMHEEESRV